jgi:hypothetical protein
MNGAVGGFRQVLFFFAMRSQEAAANVFNRWLNIKMTMMRQGHVVAGGVEALADSAKICCNNRNGRSGKTWPFIMGFLSS